MHREQTGLRTKVRERQAVWNIESLNKAYRQGYMSGLMGMGAERCPYQSSVVKASWEAGWEDGRDDHQQRRDHGLYIA